MRTISSARKPPEGMAGTFSQQRSNTGEYLREGSQSSVEP
jgi:hypothetical protein